MKKRDWTLLAIAAAEGEAITPVQLQKGLFLLGARRKAAAGRSFYRFQPYNYGPFAKEVYHDAESLQADGYVQIMRSAEGRSEYAATREGLKLARKLKVEGPPAGTEYIGRAMEWVRSLTFDQLVRAIYDEFPEQRANSVFRY